MSRIQEIQHTLTVLTANSAVSRDTMLAAYNLTLENDRGGTYSSPTFGNSLSMSAAANLADLLYRSGEDHKRLAAILAGGLIGPVVGQIISGMRNQKRQRKSELTFEKTRKLKTRFSVERNLWEEQEAIAAIALGIIFHAQDRVEIVFPTKIETALKDEKATRQWYYVTTCHNGSREVWLTAIPKTEDGAENLKLMREVCGWNSTQKTAETMSFLVLPVYENERVEEVFGPKYPGISTRLLNCGNLRFQENVVYAAVSTAAYSFLKLEIGIGRAETKRRTEELNKWRCKKTVDRREMLPMIVEEALFAACEDGIDRMIVQTSMALNSYSVRELYAEMKANWDPFTQAQLPSYETIWRRHHRLAEEFAGDEPMRTVSSETAHRVNTRRYNKKEKKN